MIFLGDLMDEGSKALGQEYMETLHRFHSVFDIASHIKVSIGVAPITQLRTCVIKIATFKGGHLMW